MLLQNVPRTCRKRLCLLIQNAPLRSFLSSLLRQWRYELSETGASADLILAEEDFPVPADEIPVLRLVRSGYGGRDRLPLPLCLEELWSTLEGRFHKPPRNHIRIQERFAARLDVRGQRSEVCLTSLSDLGTRFDYEQELVSGEEVEMELSVDGERFLLQGRVIYIVACEGGRGTERWQTGVIFDRTAQEVRNALRNGIIRIYLQKVRREIDEADFEEGRRFFALPPAALKEGS